MNLVNGCVTTINKTNDSRWFGDGSGDYKKHKLQIKNGKLVIYIRGIKRTIKVKK